MTEALHRESGGWTVTLVFVILVLFVLLCGALGLAAFAFYLKGQQPAVTIAPQQAPTPPGMLRYPPVSSNTDKPADEVSIIGLDEPAKPLPADGLSAADKTSRSFINAIASNDIGTMKDLSTARMQANNPFNHLFNMLLHLTGFEKQPELIGMRATGDKVELQYRTTTSQGGPCDIGLRLLKEEAGWKVDRCDIRGEWGPPKEKRAKP